MNQPKTMLVVDLLKALNQLTKQDPKLLGYKIYLSRDSEGNGYSTIDPSYSLQFGDEDQILTIMPYQEGLSDEDIAPIENANIMKDFKL